MPIISESKLLKFSASKLIPLIRRSEIVECGLTSIVMVASFYDHELDMPAIRKRFPANLKV